MCFCSGPRAHYIGLEKDDDDWEWEDGTDVDYTNWREGEPNGSGECVSMETDDDKWKDTDCDEKLNYVCEREKGKIVN